MFEDYLEIIFLIKDVVILESKPPLKYAATCTSALNLNLTASEKIFSNSLAASSALLNLYSFGLEIGNSQYV